MLIRVGYESCWGHMSATFSLPPLHKNLITVSFLLKCSHCTVKLCMWVVVVVCVLFMLATSSMCRPGLLMKGTLGKEGPIIDDLNLSNLCYGWHSFWQKEHGLLRKEVGRQHLLRRWGLVWCSVGLPTLQNWPGVSRNWHQSSGDHWSNPGDFNRASLV